MRGAIYNVTARCIMKRWRDILFDNNFEEPYHFHVGMRIIKTAAAVLICGLIGWLRDRDGVNFFSMIAAIICIQKSPEATIKNSFNRFVGTAIGGVYGVAVLFMETQLHLQRFMPLYLLIISLLIIPIIVTTLAMHKPTVSSFSCIVFLSIAIYHVSDANPYTYALNRLLDTIIGVIVALIINLAFPGPKMAEAARPEPAAVPAEKPEEPEKAEKER